jgi:hypothetical protein
MMLRKILELGTVPATRADQVLRRSTSIRAANA